MPRRIYLIILTLCLHLPAGAAWASVDRQAVTLQLKWRHQFQFAGYYAALEKGYYRAAGLDVSIREAAPNQDVVETVVTGEANFGVGINDVLLARYQGKPVVVLAAIFQHSPACILASTARGIDTVGDLAGRSIQFNRDSAELLAYLKRSGLDPSRLRLLPHSMELADLVNGRVDAISAYITNESYELARLGFPYREFRPIAAGIDFYGDNLFTSERMLREHPEQVAAFRAASLDGWRYAMAHPEEIIDLIYGKYHATRSRERLAWEARQIQALMMPELVEIGYMSPSRWRHIADIFAEAGLLPPGYDFSPMLYDPKTQPHMHPLAGWLAASVAGLLAMGLAILYILRGRRRLAESQARHERTAATVPGVLFDFVRHPDGREAFIYFSPRCAELFEVDPKTLIADGSWVWRMIHPDDRAAVQRAREAARDSGAAFQVVARVILPSLRQRWLQFSARANPVPSGEGVLWSGFILDVTPQREAEAARRVSEGHFRELVAAMSEGVVLMNQAGVIEDCNPAAESILGVSREKIIGNKPGDGGWATFYPDGSPLPPEEYAHLSTLNNGESRRDVLMGVDNPSGERRWISVNSDPMRSEDGQTLTGVVVTLADVTGLRATEMLLKASEARFRNLFEHIPIAYLALDETGRIVDVNDPLCVLLGVSRNALMGRSFADFWAHGQDFAERLDSFKTTGEVNAELNLVSDYGALVTVMLEGRIQRDSSGKLLRTHCVMTNVSERKRMEVALRESEIRFRDMANAAPVLMWIAGEDKGCHWFNQTWLEFTGRSMEQEVGEGWAEGVHTGDRDRILATYLRHFEARLPFRMEYRLRRHDGEYRWILDAGVPRYDEAGTFVGYIGSCADITENKAAEALARGILDAADEGILVVDANRKVLAVNQRFNKLWHLSPEFQTTSDDALLESVAMRLNDPQAFLEQVRSLSQVRREWEDELHLKDGRVFLRFTRPVVLGEQLARIWTFRDMTQLLASQRAIRDERARLRTLLETIPEPIWLKDPDGVYLACNLAFEKFYNIPEAELIGKTDHDFAAPELADFLRGKDREAIQAGRAILSEEWVTYPGTGETVLWAKIKTPMRDGDGQLVGVLGIARDITEERRIQTVLSEAKEQAEAANSAKSQFLSRMSHELRTPLNAIIGFSELMRYDTEESLTEQQQEFVGHIVDGGNHLLALINEVLDLARIETGRMDLIIEKVSLPRLLAECLDMTQPLAASRGIHLEGASPADRVVLADPVRLKQVLLNFLSNAVKYNREGGTVSVSCSATPDGHAYLAVSDTGPGIPEDKQDEVFQPFQRLGAEKSTVQGTGIGLTISKRLVEAMNGRIGFDSRPNQGTTFWIELPMPAGDEAPRD